MGKQKPVLGLIGGIGSGKSLVATELARHGGYLIAGDQLGHEALGQAEIRAAVVARWGEQVVKDDGTIDRRQLGKIVFADAAERQALEALVFPYIASRIATEIDHAQQLPDVRFIVLDAAVMLEAGWDRFCDGIIFVEAPRPLRLQRLAQQRGWSAKEVTAREQAQWPLAAKRARANVVVDNSGTPTDAWTRVQAWLQQQGVVAKPPDGE